MSITVTVRCDALNCFTEREFSEDENYENSLLTAGWFFNYEDGFHYCPSCKKKMIELGELENE